MRVAYVRVDFGDPADKEPPVFIVSPVPFLSNLYGDDVRPTKEELKGADSYSVLCAVLLQDFHIPKAMLPPAKYFKPTRSEKEREESRIYRTIPQGAGEPDWRIRARQALVWAVEEARWSLGNGAVSVQGKHCYSLDELRHELEAVAEKAGDKKRIKGEVYQPDYDVLVQEVLANDAYLVQYSGLPKTRKRAK